MDLFEKLVEVQERQAKSLEKIGAELEGIGSVLGALWTVLAPGEEPIYPVSISDEYLTTKQAAERLNVKESYIFDMILAGMKNPKNGWVQGLHYILLDNFDIYYDDNPEVMTMQKLHYVRIPWKATLKRLTFVEQKDRRTTLIDLFPAKAGHNNRKFTNRTFTLYEEDAAELNSEIEVD